MRGIPLLHDYLLESAQRLPSKVALVCGERFTYGDLDAQSNALAHALIRRGVSRGDRVLVFAENGMHTVVSFWAALKANAVVCLLSPQTKADKLAYLLADSGAAAVVVDAQLAPVLAAAKGRASPPKAIVACGEVDSAIARDLVGLVEWRAALSDEPRDRPPPRRAIDIDLASIIYTSGSTGDPRGVMLTHRNMLAAATSITSYLENTEDAVILGALPLSFDYGLYQMIMAFRMGGRLVLERSFAYPAQVLNSLVRERVTGFPGVPTMFAILAEMKALSSYDLSSVRYVTNTAAALSVKQISFLRRAFPQAKIYSMYGSTECKRCTYLPPEDIDRKPTSVGIAIPNTELWIVDENDRRLGPGEIGQLVIRGATVMRGYWGKPEATAERLRPGPLPGESVLYTGDLCKLDEEGYLYFVGRMDDVIKSRGEKVAPREVENVIANIPGVREVAVLGIADEILGQAIKALVVPEQESQLTEAAIRRECQRVLEPFMVPKYIELVPDLPKTSSLKIRKVGLA